MEKHIMGENGISYTLGEYGLYYPDLYLPEGTEYPIGKYGMLRKSADHGAASETEPGPGQGAESDGMGWENE